MKSIATLMLFVCCGFLVAGCASSAGVTDSGSMGAAPSPISMEQELIDQYIATQGGRETLQAVESLQMTGEVYMPVAGMSMPITIIQKRPSKMHVQVDVTAMSMQVVNGFDGETAWTSNPMQGGTQKLGGEQLRNFKEQADIDGLLVNYAEKGYTVEFVGEEEVKGAIAKKLQVMRPDSSMLYVYLDNESHVEVKLESESTNPMTGATAMVETYLSDYREVEGMMRPFHHGSDDGWRSLSEGDYE